MSAVRLGVVDLPDHVAESVASIFRTELEKAFKAKDALAARGYNILAEELRLANESWEESKREGASAASKANKAVEDLQEEMRQMRAERLADREELRKRMDLDKLKPEPLWPLKSRGLRQTMELSAAQSVVTSTSNFRHALDTEVKILESKEGSKIAELEAKIVEIRIALTVSARTLTSTIFLITLALEYRCHQPRDNQLQPRRPMRIRRV